MIELYNIPAGIPDDIDDKRPIIVVDIFRASTSITAALAAGAERILFASSSEEASSIKSGHEGEVLLAGEREGIKIAGYDLGNSPQEMLPEAVAGKTIVFNSTNGTKLLRRFDRFENVALGSIVSLSATVEFLNRFDIDPVICCAGTNEKLTSEDVIAAGLIISRLNADPKDTDDAAKMAIELVGDTEDHWKKTAAGSYHGRYLTTIGFGSDLDYCMTIDRFDFLPVKSGEYLYRSDRILSDRN